VTAVPDRNGEHGFVTVWMLGLCVTMLVLGGISIDLWRAFGERRSLVAAADSAARAGASGIDPAVRRNTGVLQIDPTLAVARARASLRGVNGLDITGTPDVTVDGNQVTVVVRGRFDLGLLDLLDPQGPVTITVTATAEPHEG
jgi:Flp pilus assembly protein TadG